MDNPEKLATLGTQDEAPDIILGKNGRRYTTARDKQRIDELISA
jgi:hypothetical protein